MQEYVIDFPAELQKEVNEASWQAISLLSGGDSQQTEFISKFVFRIRKEEDNLLESQRFHKRDIL